MAICVAYQKAKQLKQLKFSVSTYGIFENQICIGIISVHVAWDHWCSV